MSSEAVGSSVSMKHRFIDSYVIGSADGYDSSFLVRKGALGKIYVFDKKTQELRDPRGRTVWVMLDCNFSLTGEDKVSRATGFGWSQVFVDEGKDGARAPRFYVLSLSRWGRLVGRRIPDPDNVDGRGDGNYYV